jgi:hypothetical protein
MMQLNVQYEYNRSPISPPGTIIIAYETPNLRRTWAPHGQDGWYIGPALEHYRCYRVYINKTRSERVVEMVDFFSMKVQLPFQSTRYLATEATKLLTYALVNHNRPAHSFRLAMINSILLKSCRQSLRAHYPSTDNEQQTHSQ